MDLMVIVEGIGRWLHSYANPTYVGAAASILSLLACLIATAGWWRVRRLIADDRELSIETFNLIESYRNMRIADEGLKELGGKEKLDDAVRVQITEVRLALNGSMKDLKSLFFNAQGLKVTGLSSLVKMAKRYRSQRRLYSAVHCYELALDSADNGAELGEEGLRSCLYGLQFCAIALGDQEDASRWAREAARREIPGCKSEGELERWFLFQRFFLLMRLACPDFLRVAAHRRNKIQKKFNRRYF